MTAILLDDILATTSNLLLNPTFDYIAGSLGVIAFVLEVGGLLQKRAYRRQAHRLATAVKGYSLRLVKPKSLGSEYDIDALQDLQLADDGQKFFAYLTTESALERRGIKINERRLPYLDKICDDLIRFLEHRGLLVMLKNRKQIIYIIPDHNPDAVGLADYNELYKDLYVVLEASDIGGEALKSTVAAYLKSKTKKADKPA
jgi:hypothetical protein